MRHGGRFLRLFEAINSLLLLSLLNHGTFIAHTAFVKSKLNGNNIFKYLQFELSQVIDGPKFFFKSVLPFTHLCVRCLRIGYLIEPGRV